MNWIKKWWNRKRDADAMALLLRQRNEHAERLRTHISEIWKRCEKFPPDAIVEISEKEYTMLEEALCYFQRIMLTGKDGRGIRVGRQIVVSV